AMPETQTASAATPESRGRSCPRERPGIRPERRPVPGSGGSVVRQTQGEEHTVLVRTRVVLDARALEAQRGVEGDGTGVVRQRGRLDHVLLIGLRTGD